MSDKHMSSSIIWQCLGFSVREHYPPHLTELALAWSSAPWYSGGTESFLHGQITQKHLSKGDRKNWETSAVQDSTWEKWLLNNISHDHMIYLLFLAT